MIGPDGPPVASLADIASLPPIASLPMYDWPEVRWATDALWAAVALRLNAAGIAASETLDRSRPSAAVWHDPSLVLSQTCGWPFATELRNAVRLVATPVYAVEGSDGPLYASAIIVRSVDAAVSLHALGGRRFAVNADDSLSGFLALRAAMRDEGLNLQAAEWIETGSHRESVRAVAAGEADCAAIDSVCWALAQDHDREAVQALRVLEWTPPRPGLPLITAGGRADGDLEAIRRAWSDTVADADMRAACAALHIVGSAVLNAGHYDALAGIDT